MPPPASSRVGAHNCIARGGRFWYQRDVNRVLLEPEEVDASGMAVIGGRRAAHVHDTLHGRAGRAVKVGIVDGPRGRATIREASAERVVLCGTFDEGRPPAPRVDILLALPRPKVLHRLWAPLAMVGVGRIVLTHAAKVERNYFDTHWLLPEHYRPLLLEGLEQAGDTRLPAVEVRRRFKPLVEDELGALFSDAARVLAHPGAAPDLAALAGLARRRVVLAVGPEGGWTDWELDLLRAHGFAAISLGERRLRTDVACVALLGVVQATMG
jgi:16S rRNA (uracil1498-N3)-methyltransferase